MAQRPPGPSSARALTCIASAAQRWAVGGRPGAVVPAASAVWSADGLGDFLGRMDATVGIFGFLRGNRLRLREGPGPGQGGPSGRGGAQTRQLGLNATQLSGEGKRRLAVSPRQKCARHRCWWSSRVYLVVLSPLRLMFWAHLTNQLLGFGPPQGIFCHDGTGVTGSVDLLGWVVVRYLVGAVGAAPRRRLTVQICNSFVKRDVTETE